LGFGGFILTALRNLLDEEALRFVAPLTYFQPYPVFKDGGFETKYALTAAVVTVACLALSYWKYTRDDVPAL
jgi:ABC-2 type transport system permease protein